jgi:hypothetical protein
MTLSSCVVHFLVVHGLALLQRFLCLHGFIGSTYAMIACCMAPDGRNTGKYETLRSLDVLNSKTKKS